MTWRRLLLVVPSALLGIGTGLAAVALHAAGLWLVVVVLVSLGTALVLLPRGWWARLPYCLGWLGVVAAASVPRPEGDYLIAADLPGYALLITGLVLLVAGLLGLAGGMDRSLTPPP